MNLKNKRILITAGPTSVPIDTVRVISNVSTGETGILLAERLQGAGAKVTLLLGLAGFCYSNKNIRIIRFKFFDDLKNLVEKELGHKHYDILIHCAAVSDYKPKGCRNKKIESGIKQWSITLTPTPKIIDSIKKIDSSLFLVGFKFEPRSSGTGLINKARALMRHSRADLVVANTSCRGRYNAYIVNQNKVSGLICSKSTLVKTLIKEIQKNLCRTPD
ncbi:MAG: phosphopantothenoylcysteine decarboxylase [Candidatus Omnitrophota bacterium]